MISKLLLKLWFYKIALKSPHFCFFGFAIWGMGLRGCFTAADRQSEKNKNKSASCQIQKYITAAALVVYSLVRDEQEEQSWNKVEWKGLYILVA